MTPQEIVERVLDLSEADGCVAILDEGSSANLRWAANTLTTNGVMRHRRLTVTAVVDGTEGTAAGVVSRTAVDPDALAELVKSAEEAARAAGPAEDARPLLSPAESGRGGDWEAPPAETSIEVLSGFARDLGEAFARAREADRELFGFAEHELLTTYLGTSTGVRLRHDQPTGKVEVTGKSGGRTRSAWSGRQTRDFTDVDVADLDAEIAQRLEWAARRVELPAARYETILPPGAVADLLVYLYWSAGAREAAEGRTVFSSAGGGTRVGERLASLPLTLRSDPAYPGLESAPFAAVHSSGGDQSVFDNGAPVTGTDWIRDGELAHLITSRHSAELAGLPFAPAIDNLVLESGSGGPDLAAMVAGTQRGLLLTCLWYIREVDPRTLLLTGLTRDGVYLVEGGEVAGAVNNFRFNESPVDLLGRVSEVGGTTRTLCREWSDYFSRTAMPPVRVPDFNMSTVSQAS